MVTELHESWTHKLARFSVRPLIHSPVTPNHLTTLRLLSGLAACVAFAIGSRQWEIWGGVLWVLSAFLDRADGELARLSGNCSASGHAYDYFCDVLVNGLVFLAIGIGQRHSVVGDWAIVMGLVAGLTVSIAALLSERLEQLSDEVGKAYEGRAGFDFDDVLYVFGPLAWLAWLFPLLIGASIGGPVFALWTWWRLRAVSLQVQAT